MDYFSIGAPTVDNGCGCYLIGRRATVEKVKRVELKDEERGEIKGGNYAMVQFISTRLCQELHNDSSFKSFKIKAARAKQVCKISFSA